MKQKLLFVFSLLCVVCLGANAQDKTEKFYLGVTGYNPTTNDPVKVDATVYDDYSFVCKVPTAGSDVLGANKATIDIKMTNVASLGVSGTRSISKTVETGVSGVTATLSEALPATYSFEGATVPVTIIDANEVTANFTYNIAGISDNQIVGTPSSTADARTAWQAIVKHVTAGTTSADDSFVGFKKGTYIQFGDERLDFDTDLDVLKGEWTIDGTVQDIKDAVHVESNTATGAETYKAIIYLPAGSTLDLGSSYATLEQNAKITVDPSSLYDTTGSEITGVISGLRTSVNSNTKSTIAYLIELFDNIVGLVDAADNVPVTVEFTKPTGHLKVYAATSTAVDGVSPYAYESQYQATTHNAIAFVSSEYKDEAEGLTNVVVEYTVGKSGKYYECENFVLTDKEDFYTPVDFTALAGSYSRSVTPTGQYASVCLPFELTNDMVNGTLQTFQMCDTEKANVYFTDREKVEAGVPCIVKLSSNDDWNITLENAEICANPIAATNMQGAFTNGTIGAGHYKLVTNDGVSKFGITTEAGTLTAFRSYLDLTSDASFSAGSKAFNIVEYDETDAINSVSTAENTIQAIYTVGGAQLSALQHGVNIVKMNDGSIKKVTVK